jgi:hypothetical protein
MNANVIEIIGLSVAVLGWGAICGAAALVSIALCVLLAGIGLLFAGGLTVYAVNAKPEKRA